MSKAGMVQVAKTTLFAEERGPGDAFPLIGLVDRSLAVERASLSR